ncbi:MAG: rod shape-determining protein MreC [Candidatus Rokuibacteriota bacterium]|nr:MAG: rod shape-determining protein MreC [Candidatus Rokubacteria bacterium]PYO05852.1 MAG: rod shape-determining protein MreC [Candidatus Rokubacteria bacterium]
MKIRKVVLLGSLVAACLLLLTLQMRGYGEVARDVFAVVTTPIQTGLAKASRATFGLWATYLDWKNVRAENRRLREEVQELRVQGLRVVETDDENRRLRRLLALQEHLPLTTLSGEIIAREWGGWIRSLTVNRGRGDNVPRLTAVISPNGLIGRVVEVRPGASIVQVLTDPTSTVGAHVLRTRTPGIVEGDPRGTLRFKFMSRDGASIQSGDVLVTAGQGGLFPRGIPIGTVRSIDNRGGALFHYAELTPAVDFARVDEVLLVTGDSQRDLTAFFPTGG